MTDMMGSGMRRVAMRRGMVGVSAWWKGGSGAEETMERHRGDNGPAQAEDGPV